MATTGNPSISPADELARMADRSGTGKMRQRRVLEGRLGADLLGQAAEPRSQDDTRMGPAGPFAANRLDCFLDLLAQGLASASS